MVALKNSWVKRLRDAVDSSRDALEVFRVNRTEALRQYVGSLYGEDSSSTDTVYLNMMEMATSIYLRQFAARMPRAFVSTKRQDLLSDANLLGLRLNHLMEKMRIQRVFRSAVLDALYCFGIVKVGVDYDGEYEDDDGRVIRTHGIYADNIDLDDWVHDMGARRWDPECLGFAGHLYYSDLEDAKDDPRYSKKVRSKLQEMGESDRLHNEDGNDRVENLSRGDKPITSYRPQTKLYELWLPREGVIATFDSELKYEPLAEREWEGEELGPYHMLSFTEVPGQIMPLPPASVWRPMHEAINEMFRKLLTQVSGQKSILGVPGQAAPDGERIVEAKDGDIVRIDNPKVAQQFNLGGMNPQTFGFMMQCKEFFTYTAGNLDVLGGLSASAPTLGQDQLIAANANKRIQDMQDQVVEFDASVIRAMGNYLWQHPLQEDTVYVGPPNMSEFAVPYVIEPGKIRGELSDYAINVHPYSMQSQTPATHLQTMIQFVQQIYPILAQQYAEAGIKFDVVRFTKLFAELSNFDEMEQFMIFTGEQPQPMGDEQTAPGKPPHTTREYVRKNMPGAIRSQQSAALVQNLMGGRLQPAEEATVNRPT